MPATARTPRLAPALRAARAAALLALALPLALAACDRSGKSGEAPQANEYGPPPQQAAVSAPAPTGGGPVILCLGDSITAGYGLPEDQSYPALLQARLKAMGLPWRVVNAGVSGDTSAGGLARMDWLLKQHIDVMLVALGGNDGLRGLSTEQLHDNLAAIIEKGQAAGAKVVLAGMHMPTNYGADYTRRFDAVYTDLARQYQVPLIPFLLDGVALHPNLNQADGIHPTQQGAKIVEATVWKALAPLVQSR